MVADTAQPRSIRPSRETSTLRPGAHPLFLLMRYQHIILAKPQTVRQRCTGNLTQIAPDPHVYLTPPTQGAACGSAPHHPAASNANHFGGYPSFLPRSTLNYHSDTVLTGTVQRPALTNQGDGVEVKTPAWSVLITVAGPQVPGEGLPYQAPTTTCTWVVTMSDATGPVPISPSDFSSIDDLDHLYWPKFVAGQPQPPATLRPGQKISFELRAAEATGEGLMRWAPDGNNFPAHCRLTLVNRAPDAALGRAVFIEQSHLRKRVVVALDQFDRTRLPGHDSNLQAGQLPWLCLLQKQAVQRRDAQQMRYPVL